MVYDCFQFFNELDMLKIRLHVMALFHLFRVGDFIQVAKDNDVLIPASGQPAPHCIFLEGIALMGIALGRVIHHHMYDFIFKSLEQR